ncbi:hypothetical protein [Pyrococcus sp. NA2]|uniref:hypothetical protein n=1 Tax=Pyrococcus sp. (strain NA2) TaxID=342949 RepID=UPI00064F24C4|nr:hypothetical protein [Pyrococcus sp. NA2]
MTIKGESLNDFLGFSFIYSLLFFDGWYKLSHPEEMYSAWSNSLLIMVIVSVLYKLTPSSERPYIRTKLLVIFGVIFMEATIHVIGNVYLLFALAVIFTYLSIKMKAKEKRSQIW